MDRPVLWARDFVLITLENLLAALNFYLLMVVVSQYAMKRFGSSPAEAGLSASIFVVGGLFARLFSGKWIGRWGYKRTLLVGVIVSLVMTLSYFAVNSVLVLLAVRFLHGVGFGITTTATGTIAANTVPKERSGEGIGYFSLSQTIATAVGPFIGMFLSRHGSFAMIFSACAVASGIGMLLSPFLSLRQMESARLQHEVMKGFKLDNFIEPKVIPISIVCLFIYVCYSSVVTFLTAYSQQIHLEDAAGFFFIVYAAVILVSRPITGRLFDRKGENSLMYPAILLFAAGMLLFSQTHHGSTLLLAGALIGLGFGVIQSVSQAIAVRMTPQHRMGMATSTYFIFSDIGMGIGPLIAGLAMSFAGYSGMYLGMAIVGAGCLAVYYTLHGRLHPGLTRR
jgi:MFS family permease